MDKKFIINVTSGHTLLFLFSFHFTPICLMLHSCKLTNCEVEKITHFYISYINFFEINYLVEM